MVNLSEGQRMGLAMTLAFAGGFFFFNAAKGGGEGNGAVADYGRMNADPGTWIDM